MARLLGKPLMPWQVLVADVACEIDPVTGRFIYDEVGVSVPRQSGKTTLVEAKATHRCSATSFFGDRQRVVYTAQTRNKAREKWEEDFVADLAGSRTFGPRIKPHFGNGNEHVRFTNRSRFGIEANTEKAGHGGVLDEAYVDEAFAQPDNRLEQAFSPAMVTRANAQFWWLSAAGWEGEAPFLEPKVARGREQAEMGVREGFAYFEWSAPTDADPDDPAVWQACMPALGYTISETAIRRERRKMRDADFRRAYLNQWVPKPSTSEPAELVIDGGDWSRLAGREDGRPSPVAFAVTVSPDRRWATIALAGVRGDGDIQVQVVQAARGTGWVPERLTELVKTWRPVAVAVNPASPAGSLIGDLDRRRVKTMMLTPRDVGQGCGMLVDRVDAGTVHHGDQPLLNIAVGAAVKRHRGQLWEWAPRESTIDVSPLDAVTFALFALTRPPKRSGKVW